MQLNFLAELDTTALNTNIKFAHKNTDWLEFKKLWIKSSHYALDIETTPKLRENGNGLNPWENEIRLIQIGLPTGEICICDLREMPQKAEFLNVLAESLKSHAYVKILHNAFFDLLNLKVHLGFNANNIRDTMALSITLSAGISRHKHSLKAVCERYLGGNIDKTEQTSDWSQKLSNSQLNYAANDVSLTLKVYEILKEKIKSFDEQRSILNEPCLLSLSQIALIECNVVPAFVDISFNGFPVNLPKAKEILLAYQQALDEIKEPIESRLNLEYTAYSGDIVLKIQEVFGIKLSILEEGEDKDSACAAALFKASEKEPLLLNLLIARSLKQYIDALKRIIASAEYFGDSRCRGWYRSLGSTGSGRSTCQGSDKLNNFSGLNLQNLPKTIDHPLVKKFNLPQVRSCLEAQENNYLGVIDLAASHQRLVASKRLSGDPFLQKVLLDEKISKLSHSILAADLAKLKGLDLSPEEIESNRKTNKDYEKLRNIAKTRFYSGLNKASWRTVQGALLKSFIVCSDEDAQNAGKAFDSRYAGVCSFQRKLQNLAKQDDFATEIDGLPYTRFRTPDGRLYHCARYLSKFSGQFEPKISEVLAINWLSPEALAMKLAMIDFREHIEENQLHGCIKLVNMVHDEMDVEVSSENLDRVGILAEKIAYYFQFLLGNDLPHGVCTDPEKLVAKNYSEK